MVLGIFHALYSSIRAQKGKYTVLKSQLWFTFGVASINVMYSYRNWLGYTGGFGVAIWLMSILPIVFESAAEEIRGGKSVAKTYGVAMLIYCILHVASVFTVAYAFVPGGVYLRERPDL
jgi:Na+/H+-dicarboxylate symporter